MARQRPRARERDRAAASSRCAPTMVEHRATCRSRCRAQRSVVAPAEARAAAHGRRRSLQAAASRSSESFWTTVYPLYMQREITAATCGKSSAKGSKKRAATTGSSRSLFNMEPQRLQAVPELPAQARLPDPVQGVPTVKPVEPLDSAQRDRS